MLDWGGFEWGSLVLGYAGGCWSKSMDDETRIRWGSNWWFDTAYYTALPCKS
jgi:hypothetical protein